MQYNSNENGINRLHLKLDGRAFRDGIYLHTLIDALDELQYIIDRSYLALVNKKILTPKERLNYRLVAQDFKEGSFLSTIAIVIASTPSFVSPLISNVGPEKIWEYTKTTFEFLKFMYSLNHEKNAKKDEIPLDVSAKDSIVVVNYGEQTFNFNAPVLSLGQSTLPSYKRITQLMKHGELDVFQLGNEGKKLSDIYLDGNDAYLFDVKSKISKIPITVECEIFSFNKDTGKGKLRVRTTTESIPYGEYSFSIIKNGKSKSKSLDYAQSMLETSVIVECFIETLFDPFSKGCVKIVQLHLLSVHPTQANPALS